MKKIRLNPNRLSKAKHCFIADCKMADIFRQKYGRSDAVLKVFDLEEIKKEDDFYHVKWGDDPINGGQRRNTKLWEATQIQNILAWHDLSVPVYGLETVSIAGKLVPAQITQKAEGACTQEEAQEVYDKCAKVGEEYGFAYDKADVSARDVMDGKLIDVQTFAFTRPYEETVKDIYCNDGRYGKVYYQDVPELDLSGGPRKSEDRVKYMQLDKVNFKGKSVVDFGCAGGFFLRYADNHGAKLVLGVDEVGPVKASRHLGNLLGNFNIDYEVADLRQEYNKYVFDIAFYLSENYHIPIPEDVLDAKFVIFEDNGKESRHVEALGKEWTDRFSNIKIVGKSKDHGDKLIYHLSK